MVFFSIIVPTLNEQSCLPKLLTSLSKQIDKDFEVILVDGMSEDKTISKALLFKNKLSKLSVLETEIRNVGKQRNVGAKKSMGKWLVFLDADIILPENFLSHLHGEILKNKSIRFMTTWMEPDSKKKADIALMWMANIIMETVAMTDKPMVGGACMVIKKEAFNKVGGFNPKFIISEDHNLAQKLKLSGYNLHICRSLKYVVSLRRFRREGTLEVLRKYAMATRSILFEGPIYSELFEYQMGGKVSVNKKKIHFRDLIKKQIKNIERVLS